MPITSSVRSLYIVHCAGCHGMDGSGSALGNVPDMRRLGNFLRLEGGREFIVSVPGVRGAGLNDQQIADVTNWVLGGIAKASLPEGHKPYRAAEVEQTHSVPLLDVAAARARLKEQAIGRNVEID